ncbi:hypothetical protein SLA2020_276380 [Shorea laevis]
MERDKSWIETTRCSERYEKGVEEFLRMASTCLEQGDITRCPCCDCSNRYYWHIDLVEHHMYENRIDRTYTRWIFHGEEDPCRVHLSGNLHNDTDARIEDFDEVEQLLGDVRMGTFVDANIGESFTTWAPMTGDTTKEPLSTSYGKMVCMNFIQAVRKGQKLLSF